ncbi:hypothetical protein LTR82_004365 [Friedmanniomyces endolithicus]|uniref:Helicase C-terminal domain-containing protein n=1 Tax=Friedmanniomyces endolithicus TaxID=329885 RepID=A0AAN6FUS9_9PEZI|nr:hypothetical protein LTR82_004365 [Friedmanniomyces endolithicus]
MDADPWNWTVAEVQQFFRQDAIAYLGDRPTVPPLDTFSQSLADSEVDGRSLLDDVDVAALRDDFGISSYQVRRIILHCIDKLKERSKLHRSSNGGLPETPASLSFVPQLASVPDTPTNADILPSTEVDDNVRPGEVQVQDAHGRKRRKLDIFKSRPDSQVVESNDTGYIPDTAISLDELFYGHTKLGNEIGTLLSAGNILIEDGDNETADDNFQFHSQPQIPMRAGFVHARMCYFLMNAEVVNLRRQDRPATGILPYSDRMQGKERSATVVQIGKDGREYVAVREQALLLESGYEHKEYQQNATGDSNYLLSKYKHKQDDLEDGLPMFDGSEDGDTTSESGTSEGDARMASESVEDERMLDVSRISELVDNYIDEHIAKWRESNLPRLEATRAWTVWKKTKQSLAFRTELIRSARDVIEQLSERLTKLKQRVVEGGFADEHAVAGACGNLDPSIEDREERKWMIQVWQRRKEPEHTVRSVSKARGNTLKAHATAGAPAFIVHPDDQMSVSPTPVVRAEADRSGEVEGEIYHTPEGSPTASPGAGTDGFDASDEMSLDLDQPAEDTDFSGPEPLDDVNDDGSPEHSDTEMPQDQMLIPSSSPGRLNVPASAEHSQDRDSRMEDPDAVQGTSSSDEMPDISTFMPKRVKHTPRPEHTAKKPMTATQVIDLTGISSDSATPAKPKRQLKTSPPVKKAAPYNFDHQPTEASAMQVRAWEFGELAGRQDRKRMLIKMLSEVGPEVRDHIHQHQAADRQMFYERIHDAVEHRSHRTINSDEAMDICARIAIAWYTADPDHWLGSEEPPWARLLQEPQQIENFVNMLASILKLRRSKLFVEAEPSTKAAAKSDPASTALILSSDTDPVVPRTPLKKRKKRVLATQSAIKARQDAHKRQENYQEVIESQAANTSQVAALHGADASQSEVVINPARDVDEEDPIFIHSRIARKMKAHQIQGVRFLWREITAVSEEDGAQGCLLAHTMGLGKTMQTIALLVAVVEASESENRKVRTQLPETLRPKGIRGKRQLRMLVICPPGLLQNWQCELEQWAPKRLSNVFVVEASSKANQMTAMEDWYRLGGVLLLGYSMLRAFTDRKSKNIQYELDGNRLDKILLDGPGIVVADEAHNLKNPKSKISGVASNFRTHTRIALTGTPMSNDVDEIYALISWVAPDYLGDFGWFQDHFAEPIKAGTWFDSSHAQKRKSLMKLQVLHHDIAPKVDRADITALRGSLKPKTEFVITVSLTETQKLLYSRYINALLGGGRNKKASQVTIFSWLGVLMLLTNHPAPFRSKLLTPARPKKAKKDAAVIREGTPAESDDGSNATSVAASTALPDTTIEQVLDPQAVTGDPGDENLFSLGFTQEKVDSIIDGLEHDTNSELSAKMPIFLSIVDLSHRCHDKVLVFSGSIPTMDYVSELLESQGIPFGRIDGSTATTKRMQIIESFHRDKFEVLIVSTRAGGVGLNIQGANRVVILDFGFNPTWEEQAIGRAYRLGQTKAVFVYRFVAGGTFETNIYNKQMFKTCLAMRVVDKKNPLRNAQRNTREYLYDPKDVRQENVAQWIGRDPNVLDIILKQHSQDRDTLIRRIETTGILEEDAQDEPLDEEERKQVREEIQQGSTKQRGRMANAAPSLLNLSAAAVLAAARGDWANGRAMGPPAATQGASRLSGVVGLTPAMRDVPSAPRPPAAAPPPASAPVQRQPSTPAAQSGFRPLPPGE